MPIKFLTGTSVFLQFGCSHSVHPVIDVLRVTFVFVLSYSIPFIELCEYLELGFVPRWNGDFLPRARRIFQKFGLKQDHEILACNNSVEPPQLAEFLVGLLAKKRYRAGLLQSLDDDFQNDLINGLSLRRAQARYWAAALNSIGPQLWAAIKRVGVIGILADYVRGKPGGA
jgi:hypothetical protein